MTRAPSRSSFCCVGAEFSPGIVGLLPDWLLVRCRRGRSTLPARRGWNLSGGLSPLAPLASAALTTLEGSTITYRRMFRKDFLDNAFCGVKASPPRTSYASNVKAAAALKTSTTTTTTTTTTSAV